MSVLLVIQNFLGNINRAVLALLKGSAHVFADDADAEQLHAAQQNSQRNENRSGRSNNRNEQSSAGRVPRAPKAEQSGRNNRSRSNNVPTKDEDPGLVLISRRPPQQKFTNFEEYMNAHGGATAPIEDHSDEV
mgnify:CR=1 FL=1